MKSKKIYPPIVVTIVIIMMFVISIAYYYKHTIVNDGALFDDNSTEFAYQIEDATLDSKILNMSGWCFKSDDDLSNSSNRNKMRIIFVDTESGEFQYYNANYGITRTDINAYYKTNSKYTNCGFTAKIDISTLNNDNRMYEILLQPNEREAATIRTGLFLNGNEIVNNCPLEFASSVSLGEDLANIIEKGVLRVSRADIGIYVYQLGWKLFWIAENQYFSDGRDLMEFALYTTRPDLLPENRVESGWNNIKFKFSDAEITDGIDTLAYRVAVKDIPVDYPITTIITGCVQDGAWEWKATFCPGIH